jgi:hypothetical protein
MKKVKPYVKRTLNTCHYFQQGRIILELVDKTDLFDGKTIIPTIRLNGFDLSNEDIFNFEDDDLNKFILRIVQRQLEKLEEELRGKK